MNEQRVATDRLAAFSDAVMAVIISIMVLELKAPEDATFQSLLPLWPTAISLNLMSTRAAWPWT